MRSIWILLCCFSFCVVAEEPIARPLNLRSKKAQLLKSSFNPFLGSEVLIVGNGTGTDDGALLTRQARCPPGTRKCILATRLSLWQHRAYKVNRGL